MRRYELDHHYFDAIDSEAKAYWLGFIAADGCVMRRKWVLRVALSIKDETHLETLRADLKSELPVRQYRCGVGGAIRGRPIRSDPGRMAVLIACSEPLVSALIALGLESPKSLTLQWFGDKVAAHVQRHVIRGYLDGDGCVSIGLRHSRHPSGRTARHYASVSFVGTAHFLSGLTDAISSGCGLPRPTLRSACDNGVTKRVAYESAEQVRRLTSWLYEGASRFLVRKREVAEQSLSLPRRPAGEQHPNAKITRAQADAIRLRALTGFESQRRIAKDYSISQSLVSYIARNRVWRGAAC